jgi:predicted DCC family thiol-disulfide oxidoreductase YuxK
MFPADKSIILFDGYCHLCSGLVQHILRHDSNAKFLFCALDSDSGRSLKAKYSIAESVDSIILIEKNEVYIYAGAVLKIAMALGGFYKLLLVGRIMPKSWRDAIYRWVAGNRYGWFGKRKACMLPDASFEDRFL